MGESITISHWGLFARPDHVGRRVWERYIIEAAQAAGNSKGMGADDGTGH